MATMRNYKLNNTGKVNKYVFLTRHFQPHKTPKNPINIANFLLTIKHHSGDSAVYCYKYFVYCYKF